MRTRPGSGRISGLFFCLENLLCKLCVVRYFLRSVLRSSIDRLILRMLMTTKGSRRRIPNRVFGPRKSYSRPPYSRVACPACQKRMGVNRIARHMRTCVPCSVCEGTGRIPVEGREFPLECRACTGTGKEQTCPECGGPFPCRKGCPSVWKPIPVANRSTRLT
jgi:hypothetical protein